MITRGKIGKEYKRSRRLHNKPAPSIINNRTPTMTTVPIIRGGKMQQEDEYKYG
jgi:hypothetical protein